LGQELAKNFTKEQIEYIRNSYKNKERKQIELAKEFKVSKISIWNIIHYETYR
jgi:hypothetical protein